MNDWFDKDLLRQYMMGATRPTQQSKNSRVPDVIDLHIEDITFQKGKLDEKYAIEHQIDFFEKAIDASIAQGKTELRIVHGVGKGKLKSAIHALLKKHASVSSFDDSPHPRFGNGSTIVYFF